MKLDTSSENNGIDNVIKASSVFFFKFWMLMSLSYKIEIDEYFFSLDL